MRKPLPKELPIRPIRCQCCRAGHLMGCFAVGEHVRYASNRMREEHRQGIALGTAGRVQSYRCSPNAYLVVVRFKRKGMQPLELVFAPCELRSEDASVVCLAVRV